MIIRLLTVFASTCLAGATLLAADASFAGKWKLNPDKSKFTGLQEKIEDLGGDKFKFSFGDDTETIVLDGKDYPTKYGNMWSVTKTGPNSWKSITPRSGTNSEFSRGPDSFLLGSIFYFSLFRP